MTIIIQEMPINGFITSSTILDYERVIIEVYKKPEFLEREQIIDVELTKEEFLAVLAHFKVIEMNLKKQVL